VFYVQLKGGVVPEYIIRIKQICETPSDPDDREGIMSLGMNNVFVWKVTAENKTDAFDKFHRQIPIGCLEDYEITYEVKITYGMLLYTRDGRHIGNATIIGKVDVSAYWPNAPIVYKIETDYGNTAGMAEEEIRSAFYLERLG
jgi:hypothetical protein